MTNLGITGRKISEKLDKKTIRKGGLVNITIPTLSVNMSNEHESLKTEFFGYKSLIHYNKDRENQARNDRGNKRLRSLKRQQKRIGGCSIGNELPVTTILNSSRGRKS